MITGARTKFRNGLHTTEDNFTSLRVKVQKKPVKRSLCHKCERIPFKDYLPEALQPPIPTPTTQNPEPEPRIFCLKLEHILSHHHWCSFCSLLFRSISHPEYDLLAAEHIRKHLSTSEKLKNFKTFPKWAEQFSSWEKWTNGEDVWPFGYSRDQDEAAQEATKTVALALFDDAEDKDLKAGINDIYETSDDLANALRVTALATGVASLVDNAKTRKALAGVSLLTSQLAMFGIGKAKPLPCLVIIKAYGLDEPKHGVLSVRVFAHGRAPRAPVKEVCHFSLRVEQETPRPEGMQLWYGRMLKRKIDIPFFEQCLVACEILHGEACSRNQFSLPSEPALGVQEKNYPFRLIDIKKMSIVEVDFKRFSKPYVALSYIWGTSAYTDQWIAKGEKVRSPHTRLTESNLCELLKLNSLAEESGAYIPKTIQDAMEVCKQMGERFLWVDSLTIIQNESHPDNRANIARMGQIYSNALFTIVAGDSLGADAGLEGISRNRFITDQVVGKVLGDIQLFLPVGMEQTFDLSPWESRAWTFQEKLLSKRMLVIASGYAIWRCRGAVWREDVNALDGNSAAVLFPWTQLKPVPILETALQKAGLARSDEDESVRLLRLPSFFQYAKAVEDFSGRKIRDPWTILDAFKGLQDVLGTKEILDSPFRWGLPVKFMDVALLWKAKGSLRRRVNGEGKNGEVVRYSPPSWSWAGWEAETDSTVFEGAVVGFEMPFEVYGDEKGLLMRAIPLGEERTRPLHQTIYGVEELQMFHGGITICKNKIIDIGLINQHNVLSQVSDDWPSLQQMQPQSKSLRGLRINQLTDRHLIFDTQVANLTLKPNCFRVQTRTLRSEAEYFHTTLQDSTPPKETEDITVLREHWIWDVKNAKAVGTVKIASSALERVNVQVLAMVVSEAQYMGNEKRVDVLGYPLFNILIVEKRRDGIAERVGVGRIYKAAWRRMGARREVVVLE